MAELQRIEALSQTLKKAGIKTRPDWIVASDGQDHSGALREIDGVVTDADEIDGICFNAAEALDDAHQALLELKVKALHLKGRAEDPEDSLENWEVELTALLDEILAQ
jgi:hypothetical protein